MGRQPDPQLVALDPRYFDHPKLRPLGPHGRELHLRAICHSALHLTDGALSHEEAVELAGRTLAHAGGPLAPVTPSETVSLVDTLVAAGLLEPAAGGYAIHDFLEYQPARESIITRRRRDQARKRRAREGISARTDASPESRTSASPPAVNSNSVVAVGSSSPSSTATDTAGLPDSQNGKGRVTWATVAETLRDADDRTGLVVASVRRRYELPEAALHCALDALEERRRRKPPLVSEARYFVATLNGLGESGQYARHEVVA